MSPRLFACLLLLAGPLRAEQASYSFAWEGGGGYALRGALSFDADFLGRGLVRGHELSCFVIEGSKNGVPVGRWALGDLDALTTWRLHFDPEAPAFLVEGQGIDMPQAWNMDGGGYDCGAGGFGFNIGNAAQDICIDGELIFESQASPFRPFPAVRVADFDFPPDACIGPDLLSLLDE